MMEILHTTTKKSTHDASPLRNTKSHGKYDKRLICFFTSEIKKMRTYHNSYTVKGIQKKLRDIYKIYYSKNAQNSRLDFVTLRTMY